MTRKYEAVYIFDSALEEAAINERLDRYHALVKTGAPAAPAVTHWGKRTLAFPIKRHETGYYVLAKFETSPESLPEYERLVKLDEGVLRFLVVVEGEPPRPPIERKGAEEDEE